jgi:tripartite-type tricarboxylate transporter receptor subunit TctC
MASKIQSISAWLVAATVSFVPLLPCHALAQTPYYQGKTITIIRGGGPGGSGEFQIRPLVTHLKKYIPGNPHIMLDFMTGAAGRKAAMQLYKTKPDGLTIGSAGGAMIPGPILGLPGSDYDIDKFIYLGSTETGYPYIFFSRKEAGLNNLEKLRNASGVRIGAHSVGHSVYVTGRLFAYVLELKEPRFVVGFTDPELDIAMANGEVDARTTSNIDTLLRKDIAEKLHFHATIMNPKGQSDPRFPNLPDLEKFASSDKVRRVIDLFRAFQYPRWPIHLSPGTPKEIVQILREAMAKTFRDPAYQQEFTKLMGREPSSISGKDVEKAARELPREAEVIALYKQLAESGPLPPR